MKERIYRTPKGEIHYWINEFKEGRDTLILLPGLTADHRLFDRQIEYFREKYNILTWDAPGHHASRPFSLDFTLEFKAVWLHEIMKENGIVKPVLAGQSMGGYVGQMFIQLYPEELKGFISIDSAPLQRKYMTAAEIWALKRTGPMYKAYPWKRLLKDGANGCSETEYGRELMKIMMETYDKAYYVKLAAHGYGMLAAAVEREYPYEIDCPVMLICGENDKAGSTKRYNRKWAEQTGYRMEWIEGAGHNSNTDRPEAVNGLIEDFMEELEIGEEI